LQNFPPAEKIPRKTAQKTLPPRNLRRKKTRTAHRKNASKKMLHFFGQKTTIFERGFTMGGDFMFRRPLLPKCGAQSRDADNNRKILP